MEPEIAKRYQEISDQLAALGEEQRALLDRKSTGETLSAKEEARLKTLRQDMTAAREVFTSFMDSLSAELSKGQRTSAPPPTWGTWRPTSAS